MADGDLDIISSVHSESSELLLCTYKNDANDDLDAGGDADFRENKSKKGKITVSSWKEMQLYKFRYAKFLLLKSSTKVSTAEASSTKVSTADASSSKVSTAEASTTKLSSL